jgi:hypothetical protein
MLAQYARELAAYDDGTRRFTPAVFLLRASASRP